MYPDSLFFWGCVWFVVVFIIGVIWLIIDQIEKKRGERFLQQEHERKMETGKLYMEREKYLLDKEQPGQIEMRRN